jgi:hypothetical protein
MNTLMFPNGHIQGGWTGGGMDRKREIIQIKFLHEGLQPVGAGGERFVCDQWSF